MQRFNIKWSLLLLLVLIILVVSACDRVGRAPEDLDVTPTLTPTPTFTPSPSPTPLPEGVSEEPAAVTGVEAQLATILAEVPDTVTAGAVQWRKDNARGVETPVNIQNGVAGKVFFTEQIGGQANITFGVFNSADDAKAHFDRMFGIRESVAVGNPNQNFPAPNMFGSGLYGSYALMQVQEIYFVEVYVEAFSSTSGNPLVPLAQQALNLLEAGITTFATPDTKPQQVEAIIAALPDEIQAGDVTWARRVTRDPEILTEIPDGRGAKILYQTDGADLYVTYLVFDSAEAMTAYYNARLAAQREGALSYSVSGGSEESDLPAPNTFASSQLIASAGLLQVNGTSLVEVEMTSEIPNESLPAFAAEAVKVLEAVPVEAEPEATAEATEEAGG